MKLTNKDKTIGLAIQNLVELYNVKEERLVITGENFSVKLSNLIITVKGGIVETEELEDETENDSTNLNKKNDTKNETEQKGDSKDESSEQPTEQNNGAKPNEEQVNNDGKHESPEGESKDGGNTETSGRNEVGGYTRIVRKP